jgi:hypothetical protein
MGKIARDYEEEAELRRIELAKPWNQRGIVVARLADIEIRYKQKLKLFKKVYNEEATLLELIEAKCLDCQMMSYSNMEDCKMYDCPLSGCRKKLLSKMDDKIKEDRKKSGPPKRNHVNSKR